MIPMDMKTLQVIFILIFVLKESNKQNFTNVNVQQKSNMHIIYNNYAYITDACSKYFSDSDMTLKSFNVNNCSKQSSRR